MGPRERGPMYSSLLLHAESILGVACRRYWIPTWAIGTTRTFRARPPRWSDAPHGGARRRGGARQLVSSGGLDEVGSRHLMLNVLAGSWRVRPQVSSPRGRPPPEVRIHGQPRGRLWYVPGHGRNCCRRRGHRPGGGGGSGRAPDGPRSPCIQAARSVPDWDRRGRRGSGRSPAEEGACRPRRECEGSQNCGRQPRPRRPGRHR